MRSIPFIIIAMLAFNLACSKSANHQTSALNDAPISVHDEDRVELSTFAVELTNFSLQGASDYTLARLYAEAVSLHHFLARLMDPGTAYRDPDAPQYERGSLDSTLNLLDEIQDKLRIYLRIGVENAEREDTEWINGKGMDLTAAIQSWQLDDGGGTGGGGDDDPNPYPISECATFPHLPQLQGLTILIDSPSADQKRIFCQDFGPKLDAYLAGNELANNFFVRPSGESDQSLLVLVNTDGESALVGLTLRLDLNFEIEQLSELLEQAEVIPTIYYESSGAVAAGEGLIYAEGGDSFPNDVEISFDYRVGSSNCRVHFAVNRPSYYYYGVSWDDYGTNLYYWNGGTSNLGSMDHNSNPAHGQATIIRHGTNIRVYVGGHERFDVNDSRLGRGGALRFSGIGSNCSEISNVVVKSIVEPR